ncbi:urea carboxylase-associated family protein [Ruegeria sp. 2205SS24-7]|uniref:urea carboxylase-associated family protein n=1 Tax=Ruegeria discodermiae TaxID=3064389 RepID=UPI002741EABA|nr:urea carboxylase-associated family protein [Ruegeria sp. 2205SS24-7]MDP5218723.1 urea carboxylase-associated family protein [Ruegeria sp. 2205SS24-7]
MQSFDPSQPDGFNQTLDSTVSADGVPVIAERYTVPARCGVAVRLTAGQTLTITNPTGWQVCDFWAFNAAELQEYLSMPHVHTDLLSVFPKVGDRLVSNLRNPLLTLTQDTSPGVHDTTVAACDANRYKQLGVTDYHDNCADNLRQAMIAIGQKAPHVPAPFNLWMNVPVHPDGSLAWAAPVSKPGDSMTFKAEMPVYAVMSACPQDITPVNGDEGKPSALEFVVHDC